MHSWPTRETDLQIAAQLKLHFAKNRDLKPLFITISREFGCDAKKLANFLVEKLNSEGREHPWQSFERSSLLELAEPGELNEEMLQLLDQYGHSEFQGYIQEAIFGRPSQYRTIKNLAKMIRVLARRGHVLFVGCGASVLTKDFSTGVHFRLFAPLEWRIQNFANRWGVDQKTAEKRVAESQKHRDAFLQTYLAEAIDNPNLYDLMINNSRIAPEAFGDMALALVRRRQKLLSG